MKHIIPILRTDTSVFYKLANDVQIRAYKDIIFIEELTYEISVGIYASEIDRLIKILTQIKDDIKDFAEMGNDMR